MSQQIVERRVQSLFNSDHKSRRQTHKDAMGPDVEIGGGFLDICGLCQGEAFVGSRLPFTGAEEMYE